MPTTVNTTELLSRRETAALADVPLKVVDKAIEERVVRVRRRSRRTTLLSVDDLALIALIRKASFPLPARTKQQIKHWVYEEQPRRAGKPTELRVSDVVAIRFDTSLMALARRAEDYLQARHKYIEQDPRIQGGEPVIRGTRIPVRAIAERVAHGDTIDVLKEDYPKVPKKAFETAILYARAHPRRGRPARPWRDAT